MDYEMKFVETLGGMAGTIMGMQELMQLSGQVPRRAMIELEQQMADLQAIKNNTGQEILFPSGGINILNNKAREIKSKTGFTWDEWGTWGEIYRDIRESLFIPITDVARWMKTSKSSLRRFEAGRPLEELGVFSRCYEGFLIVAINKEREKGQFSKEHLDLLSLIVTNPWEFLDLEESDNEEGAV